MLRSRRVKHGSGIVRCLPRDGCPLSSRWTHPRLPRAGLDGIEKLMEKLTQEKVYLEEEVRTEQNFEEIVGESAALRRVLKEVETVAPTESTVLICGETGTGKELIARALHDLSPRRNRTFVKLNCAAIPTGLLESELFGHEKGAFTGAITRRLGRFELAHQGTLFLDEVGDIPPELQPKLLRVLQEQEFERLGSTRTVQVNVRLVAASNRDLSQMVADGHLPQRPLLSPERVSGRAAPVARAPRRHSAARPTISRRSSRGAWAGELKPFQPRPWTPSWSTPGPETSASWRTSSSGPSFSRQRTVLQLDPAQLQAAEAGRRRKRRPPWPTWSGNIFSRPCDGQLGSGRPPWRRRPSGDEKDNASVEDEETRHSQSPPSDESRGRTRVGPCPARPAERPQAARDRRSVRGDARTDRRLIRSVSATCVASAGMGGNT